MPEQELKVIVPHMEVTHDSGNGNGIMAIQLFAPHGDYPAEIRIVRYNSGALFDIISADELLAFAVKRRTSRQGKSMVEVARATSEKNG